MRGDVEMKRHRLLVEVGGDLPSLDGNGQIHELNLSAGFSEGPAEPCVIDGCLEGVVIDSVGGLVGVALLEGESVINESLVQS